MIVHLDTDFGGDPDDACALALLLGQWSVELTGITTNLDADGSRAGCVRHYLGLANRLDVPVATGARESMTTGIRYRSTARDVRYWPDPVDPLPSDPQSGLDLLAESIRRGATIIAIGALTNLAMLERQRPGILSDIPIVVMGGWSGSMDGDLPDWDPSFDFNAQSDSDAAALVFSCADVTFVPIATAVRAQLLGRHLERLRSSGSIGQLLAVQSESFGIDAEMSSLAERWPGLSNDLINFHWDPLTCAVAIGWESVQTKTARYRIERSSGVMSLVEDRRGIRLTQVTALDVSAFAEYWLTAVELADNQAAGGDSMPLG